MKTQKLLFITTTLLVLVSAILFAGDIPTYQLDLDVQGDRSGKNEAPNINGGVSNVANSSNGSKNYQMNMTMNSNSSSSSANSYGSPVTPVEMEVNVAVYNATTGALVKSDVVYFVEGATVLVDLPDLAAGDYEVELTSELYDWGGFFSVE